MAWQQEHGLWAQTWAHTRHDVWEITLPLRAREQWAYLPGLRI